MKILVVGNLYPPIVFGGYEILCHQVCGLLAARGHRIRVLTSAFRAGDAPDDPAVARVLDLTTSFPRPGETVGHVDFTLRALHRVGRRNEARTRAALTLWQPDLVFCWCLNRLSLGPLFAARRAGIPVAWTMNDEHPKQYRSALGQPGWKNRAKALAELLVFPRATLAWLPRFPVTLISQALKDRLLAQGLPFQHGRVIHQGIPLERFPCEPSTREPGEPLRLLYAGQVSRVKGVHTILRALGALRRRGECPFVFDVAGSGVPDYRRELEDIAAEEGLGDRVRFLGQVPHAELPSVYRDHHVLVFSSEWEEPFGLTHLEAMASGCAVVSTTTGGSAELIRDGENALAYRAGDPEHLARRLGELAGDEASRRRLALAGRAWVEERHSLQGYAGRLEAFLEEARAGRGLDPC